MTARDRIVLTVIVTFVLLAAAWFMAVAPEREKASKLDARISAASTQLASAEGELTNARGAEARYSTAYAAIVSLGKAVPPGQEVPSLIYQLDQASNHKRVEFASITTGSAASGPSASSSGTSTTAAGLAPTAFTPMPFTFVFNGSFFDLYHLFQQLNQFTERKPGGELQISGRLLTVQGVKLGPLSGAGSETNNGELSGTITATAYVLPTSQGLTSGATPSGPAGAGAQASTASAPTTAAVARVTP